MRSSAKPRAALWGLPSTESFWGAPLSWKKVQGSSHFPSTALSPLSRETILQTNSRGTSCSLAFPTQPGQEEEEEEERAEAAQVM